MRCRMTRLTYRAAQCSAQSPATRTPHAHLPATANHAQSIIDLGHARNSKAHRAHRVIRGTEPQEHTAGRKRRKRRDRICCLRRQPCQRICHASSQADSLRGLTSQRETLVAVRRQQRALPDAKVAKATFLSPTGLSLDRHTALAEVRATDGHELHQATNCAPVFAAPAIRLSAAAHIGKPDRSMPQPRRPCLQG